VKSEEKAAPEAKATADKLTDKQLATARRREGDRKRTARNGQTTSNGNANGQGATTTWQCGFGSMPPSLSRARLGNVYAHTAFSTLCRSMRIASLGCRRGFGPTEAAASSQRRPADA
jgi:hypothetical protein